MNLARLALACTVSGLVLAGIAVVTGNRIVTWSAIGLVAAALALRRLVRARARAGGDRM